jgi:hypothetical protein
LLLQRLGTPIHATVLLKVLPGGARGASKRFSIASTSVNTVGRINNGYDYLVECVFASMKDAEGFVETLEVGFGLTDHRVYQHHRDHSRKNNSSRPSRGPEEALGP